MITYPPMDGRTSHPNHGDWPGRLDDLPPAIWTRLDRATNHAGDPWRTPVVATVAPGKVPNARTVVLREVDVPRATLAFHTHVAAPKTNECRAGARITWVFFDPAAGVQLRAAGRVEAVAAGPRWRSAWERLPGEQRTLYRLDKLPGEPLAPDVSRAMPALTESRARDRFVLMATHVDTLHLLFLEPPINRAARFTREGSRWRGCWVAA